MIDNGSGFRMVLGTFSFSALPRLLILGLLGATASGVELKLRGPTGPGKQPFVPVTRLAGR
jgi:hypothetical protein